MGDFISIQVTGSDSLFLHLDNVVRRSADIREMKDELLAEYAHENQENLSGEGALVGGWKPVTPATVREKQRQGYGGKLMEERTGALFRSLTEPGTDGFRVEVTQDTLTATHDLPYVAAQDASRQLRPEPDAAKYEAIFNAHAMRVVREETFEVIA